MSNANSYSRNNGKKPVQPVFSTKVTIVLEMIDNEKKKEWKRLEILPELESDILNSESYIVDPILSMLNLGESDIYPDLTLSVNENFISFKIDLDDEEYSGEKITPKSYSRRVDSIKMKMDSFNNNVYWNILYKFDTSDDKQIRCYVKSIHLLEL